MNDGIYNSTKEYGTLLYEEGTYEVKGDKLIFTSAYRIDGDKRLNLQEDSDDTLTFYINDKTMTLIAKNGESIVLKRK